MKLVKIFGAVMAVHAAVFMFVFAIPGCRSTSKKTPATAPVIGAENTPVDAGSPIAESGIAPAEVAPVRFSPTRPGTAAAASVEAPPAVAVAAAPSTYTVVKGDNLWTIAKKNNVTVKQLTAANNMRADSTLKLGQKLTIPGKTAAVAPAGVAPAAATTVAPTAAKAASATTAPVTHVIKTGETLGSIAKKYSVKVGDIAAANNIADPTKIRVGQTLKIPGSHSAAAKASVKAAAPAAAHTKPSTTAKSAPVAPTPAPEAAPVQPAAPASPLFSSPLASPAPASSPFVSPAPDNSGAPVQHVEDSGAPKIE